MVTQRPLEPYFLVRVQVVEPLRRAALAISTLRKIPSLWRDVACGQLELLDSSTDVAVSVRFGQKLSRALLTFGNLPR